MADAQREGVQYHQCVCVIIHENGARDRCPSTNVPMDQAFCDDCEDAEHHLLPHQVEPVMPERRRQ